MSEYSVFLSYLGHCNNYNLNSCSQKLIEHVTTFSVTVDISVQITKLAHGSTGIRPFLIVKNKNCHLLFDFSDLVISAYLVNDSKAFSYIQES
jgi:hypothetical protein